MKIIFLVGQLGGGGLEKQLSYLVDSLQRENKEVFVFVWRFKENDLLLNRFRDLLGDHLVLLHGPTVTRLFRFFTQLRQIRPKFVISFTTHTNLIAFVGGIIARCHSFGAVRSSIDYIIRNGGILKRLSLIFPRSILFNSRQSIIECQSRMKMFAARAIYLPNHINLDDYLTKSATKRFVSVSVSSIKPEKRLDRLIDYIRVMSEESNEFSHLHVGGDEAGLSLFRLELEQQGLSKYIEFTGEVDDVAKWLPLGKVFTHFAEYEGSPNVVMEALAVGLPVVTTECGDVRTLITTGYNGEIVDPFKPELFSSIVLNLLQDSGLYNRYSDNAQKRVIQFSHNNYSKSLLSAIDSL